MITLKTIIEHSIPLLNYATRYIVGLNDNLKLQVEDVFNDHIGPQIMTCAVQTKNLNDTVSAVTHIKKSNTATLALIDQQNTGVANFVNIITRGSAAVSNGSLNSAAGGSLVSGIAMSDPLTLATLNKKFLGGVTERGGNKERGCWGYLKPNCPG